MAQGPGSPSFFRAQALRGFAARAAGLMGSVRSQGPGWGCRRAQGGAEDPDLGRGVTGLWSPRAESGVIP